MSIAITPDRPPLTADHDGVVRVGATRVTLDTIAHAYREGMTPETIVDQYPSLSVAEVNSVIGYMLSHRESVEAYLYERGRVSKMVRADNETRFDPHGVRDRLVKRRRPG